ncbi:MAG: 30S ribosomal protein S9 [Cyclobacteriaceae bacterium]|nr:MAG: 30S ribosomal protein S9 [Cyclobacteriaceae bacterium]
MDFINTIGRRKTSVARIYVKPGKGEIEVNERDMSEYFPSPILQTIVKQPLVSTEVDNKYDIKVNVVGGGSKGQAEAIRLAIARALCEIDSEYRPTLKKEGYLTRDPRMVERKKYGKRKARRAFQFSKR